MRAVYLRELGSYFSSMIAYITVGLLLVVLSLILWVFPDFSILMSPFASVDTLFAIAPMIFIFLIPAFTMRSFAEEKQSATLEVLLTRPITSFQIVAGKYLATLTWLAIAIAPTIIYVISVYYLGSPKGNIDLGQIAASYFGLFLLGAVFCAIGIFASSQTSNQIVAFVGSVFFCFVLYYSFYFISKLASFQGSLDSIIESLGIDYHYHSISRGIIDTRDLAYFICLIGLCLAWTWAAISKRK
ncbi:MAG: ABC transporter permease subunit [Saprospiraceae bacterium]|uniref:ABC transporter permease subunit n=1 Tax=Candidatus Opimibacter skivensis TaxID=2982028 RepID=A0A9D7ST23_9BACT|nr:ABC transporter permease subunit [Candidatus Opimibacter skivensis]